ncbi:hypothetical protein, partial [Coprococcus comes]
TGIAVSSKTDLRFPESGQQGHGARIIQGGFKMEIHKDFYFEAVLNDYLRKDNMDVFVTGRSS